MRARILEMVRYVTEEELTWGDGPRKTAESTGRFPPTPTDQAATREQSATELGAPAAEMPNMAVIRRVILKENLF